MTVDELFMNLGIVAAMRARVEGHVPPAQLAELDQVLAALNAELNAKLGDDA